MPTYFDDKQKTYYCKFSYQDWTGQRRQKMKRGFPRQRDAKDWERKFLEKQQGDPNMTFGTLYDLYIEDLEPRIKQSTYATRKNMCESHMLPYFKNKIVSDIRPADIRKWQNTILQKNFKPTYQKVVNVHLSMIFNYGIKYHGLTANPCTAAGMIGASKAGRMDFWTLDEFNTFIQHVDNLEFRTAFYILFYTGIRNGELLALTPSDFNFQKSTLSITKTYHRLDKMDIVTSPKTDNSIRTISLPPFLVSIIQEYMTHIYSLSPEDRLFPFYRRRLECAMRNACQKSGIKKIRLHDIRHSHVSLLIDMGFSPHLVAERIGDTVDMVNSIYGHLYPDRHKDVANKLQELQNVSK